MNKNVPIDFSQYLFSQILSIYSFKISEKISTIFTVTSVFSFNTKKNSLILYWRILGAQIKALLSWSNFCIKKFFLPQKGTSHDWKWLRSQSVKQFGAYFWISNYNDEGTLHCHDSHLQQWKIISKIGFWGLFIFTWNIFTSILDTEITSTVGRFKNCQSKTIIAVMIVKAGNVKLAIWNWQCKTWYVVLAMFNRSWCHSGVKLIVV